MATIDTVTEQVRPEIESYFASRGIDWDTAEAYVQRIADKKQAGDPRTEVASRSSAVAVHVWDALDQAGL